MTPQQTYSSTITPNVHLIYKLFLLENARSTLEQELCNFTKQAYEDVHNVLHSSSTTAFNDLTKKLDAKCQEIGKLSASLKDFIVESKLCIQSSVRTHYFQPLKVKENPMMGAFKFGPLLQNFLMASSMSKAVRALGAALSCQQLKLPLNSQPVVVQQVDASSIMSPSFNIALSSSSSRYLKPEEPCVLEEKGQLDSVCFPLVITQSCGINEEKSNMLLPPMQDVFPTISNRKQLTIWERDDDATVQHQKQSSSQLLHFLRVKARNECALEVTILEWTKGKFEVNNSDSPEQMSPSVKTQSHRFRHVVTDPVGELPPTLLHTRVESQAPIFRVKRVKSSGSLIYSCVIASETELWDVGDVVTNVLEEDFARMTLESKKGQNTLTHVQNFCRNRDWSTHTLQVTEPELRSPTPKRVNIPEFQIQKFEETEVVVSHVVDPGSFYIQRADSLQKLQTLFTGCEAVRTYAEQKCIPDIGAHVMGYFSQDERWCRAQVMKICGVSPDNGAVDGAGSIKVEVKRLDYGDTSCLSLWSMKELTPEMAALPLQALQVSLANVTPINGSHWSEEAVAWIRVMVHNRTLYARFYPQGSTVAVELFLEKGKLGAMRRGASLSLRLAQNGHAKHDKFRNAACTKRSAVRGSDWGKYLISCYAQTKK